jgi:predicted RNA binding protein YcfA (HicA-like mRNA interferase family)
MIFTDVSSDRAIKAFRKAGFKIVTKGKHFGMSDGTHRITIPNHKRLNPYTLKSIIKSSGLTDEQFKQLL